MIKKVLKQFKRSVKSSSGEDVLYRFVYNTSSAEKKKVLKEVVKKVNEDQRAIYYGK